MAFTTRLTGHFFDDPNVIFINEYVFSNTKLNCKCFFCSIMREIFVPIPINTYSATENVYLLLKILIHSSWILFTYLSLDVALFSCVCLSCAHIPCLLFASICTHPLLSAFPIPLRTSPRSLSSRPPLVKPPHWPSPSNHMIIWHNVTPPDAWWGL